MFLLLCRSVGRKQAGGAQPAPTESAADSTADIAAFSRSDGGGYLSVPPSSLWGPPTEVTTSPAAAVETEAAGQPAPGVGHLAEASLADAGDDAAGSPDFPRADQAGEGWPSNRPATHAGSAPGMQVMALQL